VASAYRIKYPSLFSSALGIFVEYPSCQFVIWFLIFFDWRD